MGLEITLAGEVSIRDLRGQTLTLRSARARLALAVLTLERSKGVSRQILAETVWPYRMPRTWDSALRTVISEVRAFLAHALPAGSDPLVAVSGLYRLVLPEDVLVDVEVAEVAVFEARDALASGDLSLARARAEYAAEILRAPFLPDEDAEWVVAHQERLGRLLVVALEVTSQAAAAMGDGVAALTAADEAIARAPLRESAHRCRMAAYVAEGNRAEALRAYQMLRLVLAEELGTDPAAETEAAYLALLGSTPLETHDDLPGVSRTDDDATDHGEDLTEIAPGSDLPPWDEAFVKNTVDRVYLWTRPDIANPQIFALLVADIVEKLIERSGNPQLLRSELTKLVASDVPAESTGTGRALPVTVFLDTDDDEQIRVVMRHAEDVARHLGYDPQTSSRVG